MGGGNSKDKEKAKQMKAQDSAEAAAAEDGVKANITGKVKQCDFRDYYVKNSQQRALGAGVTGAVHAWAHKTTGTKVAVKSVKKRGMSPEAIASMKREIHLLSMLDHPNIVKILEAFEDEKAITIVMEICTGGELFDNLIVQKSYTQQRAATLFKQMVSSVGYCHKMNVAHRDLKLENFVFESRDADAQLKLIDFGLSNRYQSGGIKRMKSLVGTPYYMAPEVIDRSTEYGNECDVWSLGVILYMMLTGQPPFNGNDELHIMESVRNNDIEFEDEHWESMPGAQSLVEHMLQVDIKKRFTCDQVLASKWTQEFSSSDSKVEQIISGDVIKSMTKYANMEKLKKTAVQVVALTLSPAEINKLRDQFKAFDIDGSGTLSLTEFRSGMEKHAAMMEKKEEHDKQAMGMDNQAIAELFSKIDSDQTGLISYSEFISASLSTAVTLNEERLCAAFDRLDPDSSGYIDADELGTLLKETVKQEDVDKMIADADAGGDTDGKISRKEFLSVVLQQS